MEGFDIVAILGTGATGFSFLMLYMGYRLTSDTQQKILAKDISDTEPEQLRAWEKITEKQIANTRFFYGLFSTVSHWRSRYFSYSASP